MIVVSDTSPIINLAQIGCLHLLPAIYGKIVLPQAVFSEITAQGYDAPGASEVLKASWIEVRDCTNENLINSLKLDLDAGEAEAIALAFELSADWLLIDERLGRRKAQQVNLKVIGILGILIEAKRQNLIKSVCMLMDQLQIQCRFRISPTLYLEVKRIAGE